MQQGKNLTKDILVPLHGLLQRSHCILSLRQVLFLHPDAELHFLSRLGGEGVFQPCQITSHQSKEIARLWEWVLPGCKVPVKSAALLAGADLTCVWQKNSQKIECLLAAFSAWMAHAILLKSSQVLLILQINCPAPFFALQYSCRRDKIFKDWSKPGRRRLTWSPCHQNQSDCHLTAAEGTLLFLLPLGQCT